MFSLSSDEKLLYRCSAIHKKRGGMLITTSHRIAWISDSGSVDENITILWEDIQKHQYAPNKSKKAAVRFILINSSTPLAFDIMGGQVKDGKSQQIELRRIISDFIESSPNISGRPSQSTPSNESNNSIKSHREAELEADPNLYQLYK